MYDYKECRKEIFTENGVKLLIEVKDLIESYLEVSEAFKMNAVLKSLTGDCWTMMACVDYFVEMGLIKEIDQSLGDNIHSQGRVFVKSYSANPL